MLTTKQAYASLFISSGDIIYRPVYFCRYLHYYPLLGYRDLSDTTVDARFWAFWDNQPTAPESNIDNSCSQTLCVLYTIDRIADSRISGQSSEDKCSHWSGFHLVGSWADVRVWNRRSQVPPSTDEERGLPLATVFLCCCRDMRTPPQ
jgi:hypothetical protein